MKRTHDQMSRESHHPPACNSRRPSSSSSSSTSRGNNANPSSSSSVFGNIRLPSGFTLPGPRSSYDMRRPAMSRPQPPPPGPNSHSPTPAPPPPPPPPPQQDFIDLTEESSSPVPEFVLPPEHTPDPLLRRPPTLHRYRTPPRRHPLAHSSDIIDLSEESDSRPMPPNTAHRSGSPEIQFLSSRTRSRSVSIDDRQSTLRPPVRYNRPQDVDEPAPWAPPQLPGLPDFGIGAMLERARDQLVGWEMFNRNGDFQIPNMMDFQTVGFDLDFPDRQPPVAPRLPTYEAPGPARPGFKRSPKDGDVLVCPICDDELGTGESDTKRQVWVVKACGHV